MLNFREVTYFKNFGHTILKSFTVQNYVEVVFDNISESYTAGKFYFIRRFNLMESFTSLEGSTLMYGVL